MAVNEQIVTGRKFRKLVDEATKLWQRISFWTKATDVEFDDGQTAESKMGAIKGITTDLNVTETGYAADATMLTQLYSEIQGAIQMLKNDLSVLDTRVTNAINGGSLAPPFSYNWINSPYTNLVGSVISLFENTATSLKGGSRNHPSAGGSFNLGRNWSTGIAVKNGYKFVYDISNYRKSSFITHG